MAKQTIVRLLDDIDGSDATETVTFALDGVNYTIDLNDGNAQMLRDALSPYVQAAAKVGRGAVIAPPTGRGAGKSQATADRALNGKIRAWAQKNGYNVSDRGRIPADVIDAFHSGTPAKGKGEVTVREVPVVSVPAPPVVEAKPDAPEVPEVKPTAPKPGSMKLTPARRSGAAKSTPAAKEAATPAKGEAQRGKRQATPAAKPQKSTRGKAAQTTAPRADFSG